MALPDQVQQDLTEPHGVADDLARGRRPRSERPTPIPCRQARTASPFKRVAQVFAEVEAELLQLEPARLDLGEIENVVDDRQQVLARVEHRAGILPLPRASEVAFQQEFRHAHDGVQGRADFVAHIGQEVALGPAGGLDGLDLPLDRIVGER